MVDLDAVLRRFVDHVHDAQQLQPFAEESLDDGVVEVAGDAFAVFGDGHDLLGVVQRLLTLPQARPRRPDDW